MANWYYYVPLVNYFYFIFIDSITTEESVESVLNTIALVGALLLTVSCAVPTAVNFEELTRADAVYDPLTCRCNCPTARSTAYNVFEDTRVSVMLAHRSQVATFTLGLAVLGAALLLLSVKSLDSKASFQRWWKFCRWLVLVIFVFLIVGVFFEFPPR